MSERQFKPYVPPESDMKEFTIRALVIGLVMCVILGAANAYFGLKAGMTIAATYPAAVIGMAVLRMFRGTILEENYARTVGSIGESVAAGAIFTIPAFLIAGVWTEFWSAQHYFEACVIMLIGGMVGILFVAILRRVMVEDKELPFPESVAAAEIHKAGRTGKGEAKFLFAAMGLGGLIQILKEIKVFAADWSHFIPFSAKKIPLVGGGSAPTGGGALLSSPGVSPAYMGVGYIIGPQLASLNFAGGLLAWGLFVPLLLFFLGPGIDIDGVAKGCLVESALVREVRADEKAKGAVPDATAIHNRATRIQAKQEREANIAALAAKSERTPQEDAALDKERDKATADPFTPEEAALYARARDTAEARLVAGGEELETARSQSWTKAAVGVWKDIVRKIAIGGMLLSAAYTLFRMRKSLASGLSRAIGDVKKAAGGAAHSVPRTDKDLNFKTIVFGLVLASLATFAVYFYFAGDTVAAIVATAVMIVAGFFFSAVSGNLVGLIGSSNNPISGLTISTLLIAALLMVALGVTGIEGVAAVLGVAAVICVAAAVAGEMLQDLKVGHILGGTPWKMQLGDMVGVVLAAAVMFFPLWILHEGDKVGGGLGGSVYPAPQASLMAALAQGIVGGDMAWPLVVAGMLMAFGLILVRVRSPMLVCVGMYLPLETSFAIFIGGMIKGLFEKFAAGRKFNDAQKIRSENNGVLLASGLIAGEALVGLLFAALAVLDFNYAEALPGRFACLPLPFVVSLLVFVLVAVVLIRTPLRNAGSPDDPAPPSAMM